MSNDAEFERRHREATELIRTAERIFKETGHGGMGQKWKDELISVTEQALRKAELFRDQGCPAT